MAFSEDLVLVEKAAEQGDAKAQYLLGTLYLGQKLYETAFKWFHKAAEQGDINAQSKLGCFYLTGQGVLEDKNKALEWFSKAAEKGEARAQFYMGLLSNDGVKAAEWYRKAAKQGDIDAQRELVLLEKKEREQKERKEREHQEWLKTEDGQKWQAEQCRQKEKEREEKETQKRRWKIGRIAALSLAVFSIIMLIVSIGISGEMNIGMIFLTIFILIPFAVVYFCEGIIKRIIFFVVGIGIAIGFILLASNYLGNAEIPFLFIFSISYTISCVLAMINKKDKFY